MAPTAPARAWKCSSCGKDWDLEYLKEDAEIAEYEFEEVSPQCWVIRYCPECRPGIPEKGWLKRAKDPKPFQWRGKNPEKLV